MILTTLHRLKRKSGLGRPLQNSCEAPCNWSSVWPLAEPSETQYWLLACLLYQQERNSLGWSVWALAANLPGLPSTIYLENAPQGLRERWHPFSKRCVYTQYISPITDILMTRYMTYDGYIANPVVKWMALVLMLVKFNLFNTDIYMEQLLSLNPKYINTFLKRRRKKETETEMDVIKGVTTYSPSTTFQAHLNVETRPKQGHHWPQN